MKVIDLVKKLEAGERFILDISGVCAEWEREEYITDALAENKEVKSIRYSTIYNKILIEVDL